MTWPNLTLHSSIESRFPNSDPPVWYKDAVRHLRGGADWGMFGRYLFELILETPDITSVLNIGTARGHSAVCAAKALKAADRPGKVFTIDTIDPDEPIDWHGDKHLADDPAQGKLLTMRELVGRFHDPEDAQVPIKFLTGGSGEILEDWDLGPVDLVFHDGLHTYERVIEDIRLINGNQKQIPYHILDDCHLLSFPSDRPIADLGKLQPVFALPKIGPILEQQVRDYHLARLRYPGIRKAAIEALTEWRWGRAEVVLDEDHAPLLMMAPPAPSLKDSA